MSPPWADSPPQSAAIKRQWFYSELSTSRQIRVMNKMLGCCAPTGRPGAAPSGWRPVKNGTPYRYIPCHKEVSVDPFTLTQTGLWDEEPNKKSAQNEPQRDMGLSGFFGTPLLPG